MSPGVRFIPSFVTAKAKQAGWLAPIGALLIFIPLIYVLFAFADKYKDIPFPKIMEDICGIFLGKLLSVIYFIWLTILIAIYISFYNERLLSTILPNVKENLFIIIMIFCVIVALKKSFVAIVRMNEIVLPLFVIVFLGCVLFSLPDIDVKKFLPVSRLDVIPVAKASLGITGIWCYVPLVFLFCNAINNKQQIRQHAFSALSTVFILTVLLIVMCIGVLGPHIIESMPIPFFVAVRQIDLFNTIERIEAVVVSIWIFSDFMLIASFVLIALNTVGSIFKLDDTKAFIGVYCVFLFFLSLYLARNLFELECFSNEVYIYLNILFAVVLPVLIFIIGRVRKKV